MPLIHIYRENPKTVGIRRKNYRYFSMPASSKIRGVPSGIIDPPPGDPLSREILKDGIGLKAMA